jgi:ribonuclease G
MMGKRCKMKNTKNVNTKEISSNLDQELQEPPKEEQATDVDFDQINEAAQERAKKRPIIQRIVKALQKDSSPFREVIINTEPLEKRVAVLVDGVLDKFDLERVGEERIVGSIFKGKIQNLEPGLKAAFVDIGMPKNAFLHYWDILPAANDSSVEIVRDNKSAAQRNDRDEITLKEIPKLYPIGKEIVLQVTKGQIGSKGPRTTTNIALPGRYLVFMPYAGQCGISRKIESSTERQRLKKILRTLTIPEGMGVIVRTAGEGKKLRYFVRDLHILLQTWDEIQHNIDQADDPTCIYNEPDIIERTARDFLTEDIDRVLVDDEDNHQIMLSTVDKISPRSKSKVSLFKENIPIFERFNIEQQIEQTYQRKVSLPSGGEIVVEETEALVAIDVNTGGHKQKQGDSKDFIVQANLEAAKEISRQIRLRNIGGLIIIDFIDMKQRRDRNAVFNMMRDEMTKDRAKCHILAISQLGIMQMTRQRHKESVSSGLYTGCPYCNGRGIVKSPRTMSVEIQRRLGSVIRRLRSTENVGEQEITLRILCHPSALERLRTEDENLLVELEDLYRVKLAFRADPSYHVENFKIFDAETGQELR